MDKAQAQKLEIQVQILFLEPNGCCNHWQLDWLIIVSTILGFMFLVIYESCLFIGFCLAF